MESTNLSETERVGDVYVVSAETSIDLVKIEPADEYDEDVVVEDDDADYNETASSLATSMYTYTQFNETSGSSSTHFETSVPMEAEKIETEFQLKFANESGDKEIKINLLNFDWRI
jgi:hypothetical protein